MSLNTHEQILELIKNSKSIMIAVKKDYTEDSIASAIALSLWLEKMDKVSHIYCYDFTPPHKIKFLPNTKGIKKESNVMHKFILSIDLQNNPIDEFSYDIVDNNLNIFIVPKKKKLRSNDIKLLPPEYKYDLIIVVDTPDLEQLDLIYDNNTELFFDLPIINIDHVADNEKFGQINYIDLNCTASAEILFDLFNNHDPSLIDQDIATCLLTGIIAHTKGFQTFQITPKALTTVSKLIARGARREEIIEHLFRTKDMATLKIWGKALVNLKYDPTYKLVWSTLLLGDFTSTQATADSLPDIIDELIAHAPEAKIIVIVYEKSKDVFNALIYSDKNINVLELTDKLSPQGKKNFVKIELNETSIHIATEKIITQIRNQLKLIPEKNR